jgi:hypothetical protein
LIITIFVIAICFIRRQQSNGVESVSLEKKKHLEIEASKSPIFGTVLSVSLNFLPRQYLTPTSLKNIPLSEILFAIFENH